MAPTAARHWRELARRTGNGVEVALLLNESVDLVKIAVSDGRLCHHVDLELGGADALSAFHQPFVDAASRLMPANPQPEIDEFWGFGSSLEESRRSERTDT